MKWLTSSFTFWDNLLWFLVKQSFFYVLDYGRRNECLSFFILPSMCLYLFPKLSFFYDTWFLQIFSPQKKLIVELVRIQNDGTVEVDLDKSAPVASEFLEFQPVEGPPIILDDTSFSDSKKSIPRLNIAILVVGTRGDVQPFLAMAKRLQACLTWLIFLPVHVC